MKGIKKNKTRSGLYYDGYRILKEKRPAISIIENVKNLTSKRFKNEFESILKDIKELGYNNYWQVLNAKDYGIPQNRERVFIISIRQDIDKGTFCFPQKEQLLLKLKDLLETNVDNKYYLTEKGIGRLIKKNNKLIREMQNPNISACIIAGYSKMDGRNSQYIADESNTIKRIGGIYDNEKREHQAGSIYDISGLSPTLVDMSRGGFKQPMVLINEGTKKSYNIATIGDSINISFPNNTNKRGRVGKEIAQTIMTAPNIATLEMFNPYNNKEITDIAPTQTASCGSTTSSSTVLISEDNKYCLRIRKLTPLECFRLMGFDDIDFHKAKSIGISNTQLYRQAGNSIVVNVLEKILYNIFSLIDL